MRLDHTFARHPKVTEFARLLEIEPVQARGHLVTLYLWTLEYRPDGALHGLSNITIASVAEWRGDVDRFVHALISTNLTDESEHGLSIHDWMDYAAGLKDARRKQRERKTKMRRTRPGRVQDVSWTRPIDVTPVSRAIRTDEDGRTKTDGRRRTDEDGRTTNHVEMAAAPLPPQDAAAVAEPEADSGPSSTAESKKAFAADVDTVVAHYKTHHSHARPGDKEKRLIRARLKEGYSTTDLCRAIDGNHASPFHCGQNKDNREYHGLELIMRDSDHVATFVRHATYPPRTVLPERTQRNLTASQRWLERQKEREKDAQQGNVHHGDKQPG